jgi:hypothetical protein
MSDREFREFMGRSDAARVINVLIDRNLPLGAADWIDLSRWRGGTANRDLDRLRQRVLEVSSGERRRRWTWKASVTSAGLFLAGVIGVLSGSDDAMKKVCSFSPVRSMICSPRGWGGVATPRQEREYRDAVKKGCEGLRELVRAHPENPRANDARRLLEGRSVETYERWHVGSRITEFYVLGRVKPSRESAVARSRIEATQRVSQQCAAFPATPDWHPGQPRTVLNETTCIAATDGWRCDVRGRAVCLGARRQMAQTENCRAR